MHSRKLASGVALERYELYGSGVNASTRVLTVKKIPASTDVIPKDAESTGADLPLTQREERLTATADSLIRRFANLLSRPEEELTQTPTRTVKSDAPTMPLKEKGSSASRLHTSAVRMPAMPIPDQTSTRVLENPTPGRPAFGVSLSTNVSQKGMSASVETNEARPRKSSAKRPFQSLATPATKLHSAPHPARSASGNGDTAQAHPISTGEGSAEAHRLLKDAKASVAKLERMTEEIKTLDSMKSSRTACKVQKAAADQMSRFQKDLESALLTLWNEVERIQGLPTSTTEELGKSSDCLEVRETTGEASAGVGSAAHFASGMSHSNTGVTPPASGQFTELSDEDARPNVLSEASQPSPSPLVDDPPSTYSPPPPASLLGGASPSCNNPPPSLSSRDQREVGFSPPSQPIETLREGKRQPLTMEVPISRTARFGEADSLEGGTGEIRVVNQALALPASSKPPDTRPVDQTRWKLLEEETAVSDAVAAVNDMLAALVEKTVVGAKPPVRGKPTEINGEGLESEILQELRDEANHNFTLESSLAQKKAYLAELRDQIRVLATGTESEKLSLATSLVREIQLPPHLLSAPDDPEPWKQAKKGLLGGESETSTDFVESRNVGVQTVHAGPVAQEEFVFQVEALDGGFRNLVIALANIREFHNNLEVDLSCKHCFRSMRHPKILWPCGHTFCHECVQLMHLGPEAVRCSECGVTSEHGFTPNASVEKILELLGSDRLGAAPITVGLDALGRDVQTIRDEISQAWGNHDTTGSSVEDILELAKRFLDDEDRPPKRKSVAG